MQIDNATFKALMNDGISAQGDLLIVRRDLLGATREGWEVVVSTLGGRHVVAHSETGHHHVLGGYTPPGGLLANMTLKHPNLWRNPKLPADQQEIRSIVEVPADSLGEIVHMRETHRHETHILPPGEWVLIRQQRPTPEGWRVVAD